MLLPSARTAAPKPGVPPGRRPPPAAARPISGLRATRGRMWAGTHSDAGSVRRRRPGGALFVVHGIWAYGALCMWAEDSLLPAASPPRPGRPSRAPRPHPFARDAAMLVEIAAQLAEPAADLARKAVEDELVLLLPSTSRGPL